MTKQDVYLIKYLFNQGELKIKICDFIKVKKIENGSISYIPIPIEVFDFIINYKVWGHIYLTNLEKLIALQELKKYYVVESKCIEADFGGKKGYPNVYIDNKQILASRYIYQYNNKMQIPDNCVIMHKCDNKRCIRVSHLLLGTQKDNIQDKVNKGRQARAYELDTHEEYIVKLYEDEGKSFREIAKILSQKLSREKVFDHKTIRYRYSKYKKREIKD